MNGWLLCRDSLGVAGMVTTNTKDHKEHSVQNLQPLMHGGHGDSRRKNLVFFSVFVVSVVTISTNTVTIRFLINISSHSNHYKKLPAIHCRSIRYKLNNTLPAGPFK